MNEVLGGVNENMDTLVDKAVEMLEVGDNKDNHLSETEQPRSDSRQKKRKLELVDKDFFPSAGKLPNFKKKADALKKKKAEGAGRLKKASEDAEKKKKKRTKSFLVRAKAINNNGLNGLNIRMTFAKNQSCRNCNRPSLESDD